MDKALVISGASRGIGRTTAEKFLAEGYRVINLSRTDPQLNAVEHVGVDFSDINWANQCQQQLLAAVGEPEQLTVIHNSGQLYKDRVDSLEPDALHQVLQVNLVASLQLNQMILPLMKPGSSIIYVGSTLSEKAVANACSYVVSKHAVAGLMRATCQDLAGSGIHTTCVCPGFTETEMLRDHVGESQEVLDIIASGVTFGRLIEPREIAETLFFCASQPVINGSVIHANLGQIET